MDPSGLHPELTPPCWAHVFSMLPSSAAARVACVQKLWKDLVNNDEHLWKRVMAEELGLSSKRGADGAEKLTFRAAYVSWRQSYGPEYWPFLPRAIRAWQQIKDWLAVHYPAILQTIKPGLSEAEVGAAEAELGFRLPPALKVIYRLHDGQDLLLDAALERHCRAVAAAQQAAKEAAAAAAEAAAAGGAPRPPVLLPPPQLPQPPVIESAGELASIFHGLFGGYSVYAHTVVGRMMPLGRAVMWSREMELSKLGPRVLAFACSYRVRDKLIVADLGPEEEQQQGQGGQQQGAGSSAGAAAPSAAAAGAAGGGVRGGGRMAVLRRGMRRPVLQPAGPTESSPGARDGPLRWFEEYGRRLAEGYYEVACLDEDYEGSRAICLFPLQPPLLAEAITRGVRVRASVVYAPEQSPPDKHLFAYCIRMSLLDAQQARQAALQQQQQGGGAAAAVTHGSSVVSRCQLLTRHWFIKDSRDRVETEVHGEGVIGKYPVLEPGAGAGAAAEEFTYCSCTHQGATRGSMEGSFDFMEGSAPGGDAAPAIAAALVSGNPVPAGVRTFNVACPTFRLDVPEYIF
ncbi:hypothetical protein Agub_g6101 [Astrephomene gubernaculifera]|uniref:ApaG domain-containing protein n=1 Tax=Astrephomene gubernaculifera TaxID=47775 RepID=A0AAD3DMU9_9CHLO|nr:hypothetical protein Agub_g6101 [Astrephomene gubernaculifera]